MPAKPKQPKPQRRTQAKVDVEKLGDLAYKGLSNNQIADYFTVDPETIARNYADELAKHRARRAEFICSKQMELAENLDRVMLIWLGKQIGQRDDSSEVVANGDKSICITFKEIVKQSNAEDGNQD